MKTGTKQNARRGLALALAICLLVVSFGLSGCQKSSWSYRDVKRGVVRVWASQWAIDDDDLESWGTGSGFGVGKVGEATQYFVTNRHVVVDDDGRVEPFVYLLLDDDSFSVIYEGRSGRVETNPAHVVRCEVLYPHDGDPESPDLAILRAERLVTERIAVPLKSGFDMEIGDQVFTMGYPGSADDILLEETDERVKDVTPASIKALTVADGIISRVLEFPSENFTTAFQHTAPINHGNSGGPLVTADGYVIGLNTWGWNYHTDTQVYPISEYQLSFFVDYAMQKLDELGLSYDKYPGWKGSSAPNPMLIGGVAVGAAAIVLLAVLLKKKAGGKTAGGAKKGAAYRLQGIGGTYAGKRFPLEGTVRLGRDPGRADLVYPKSAASVSGLHCQLDLRGGEPYLQDCGSTNGTFLNGRRLAAGQAVKLRQGDKFYLAQESESFLIDISRH